MLTNQRSSGSSPHFTARLTGIFYLLNIVTSLFAFTHKGTLASAAGFFAAGCYITVTVLFYYLFKSVNRSLSLIAALFSLAGCAVGILSGFHLASLHINNLVFFGFYCVLIGYLILRSTFLPRILGVLMGIAGLGWLTFLAPPLARYFSPYPYIAGGIGEGLLTLWLLIMGVNSERWRQRAGGQTASQSRIASPI
jgi:hypothetical protein